MSLPPLIELCPAPRFIVWDITYACPLRCSHCYSESGRRPSRQLMAEDLFRVTDALTAAHPEAIVISGGEPLVVKELFAVTERMVAAGVAVVLYTSGWFLPPEMLPSILRLFSRVTVSVDGGTRHTHDRIRGRAGSFERALDTLAQLDHAIGEARRRGEPAPYLGIDYVVMRSNLNELREVCTDILPRFPMLTSVSFGAVIPTGLASRPSFERHELLDGDEARRLASSGFSAALQALAPPGVEVSTTDNRRFQLHPALLAAGADIPPLQVEPDGMVRAMPIYEGTVGSLLEESLPVLWERAIARWSDSVVVDALSCGFSMHSWAEATRKIDLHFGTPLVRERIERRPLYAP